MGEQGRPQAGLHPQVTAEPPSSLSPWHCHSLGCHPTHADSLILLSRGRPSPKGVLDSSLPSDRKLGPHHVFRAPVSRFLLHAAPSPGHSPAVCLCTVPASPSLPPNTNGLRSPWASTICCILVLGPAPNVEAENAVFRVFSQPPLQLEGSCEARALLTRPSEPSRGVRGRGRPGWSLRLTRQLQD